MTGKERDVDDGIFRLRRARIHRYFSPAAIQDTHNGWDRSLAVVTFCTV